tara:strand:- start:959 stop:1291 length:333 start_codon:yes stop_codon:yes gene_type:complete
MLNTWWKELEKKPFGVKPVRIRHIVETAHAAGWTINECYEALNVTWGFTEKAFETALRRIAEENKPVQSASNVASIETTLQAIAIDKREALSIDENVKRLRELKEKLNKG